MEQISEPDRGSGLLDVLNELKVLLKEIPELLDAMMMTAEPESELFKELQTKIGLLGDLRGRIHGTGIRDGALGALIVKLNRAVGNAKKLADAKRRWWRGVLGDLLQSVNML